MPCKFSPRKITGAVLLLPDIFQALVLTSNLDSILEDLFEDNECKFDHVLSGTEIESYPSLRSRNKAFLLKLHGDNNYRSNFNKKNMNKLN